MSGDSSQSPVDSDAETIHTQYDWASTAPSAAVIRTVAIARNEDPMDMPLLYSCVNPDALDSLFTHLTNVDGDCNLRISFPYASYEVTITGHGKIVAKPQHA